MAQASTEPVPYPRGEFSGLVKMNLIQSKLEEASRLRGRCAHARLFEAVELAIDGFAQAVLDHGSSEDLSDVLRDEQALFAHQVRRLIALCRAGEHEIAIEPRLAHLPLYAA